MQITSVNRKGSILVVDDSEFIARLMTKMVDATSYRVVGHAKNGQEAIQKYIEIFPDIVTMDIVMPCMGGLETIQELVKVNPRIKLIVVSAMGHANVVQEAMKLGAKQYLIKPFLKNSFITALDMVSNTGVLEAA
jgi:two-component system chemotaxis response regulator CheY